MIGKLTSKVQGYGSSGLSKVILCKNLILSPILQVDFRDFQANHVQRAFRFICGFKATAICKDFIPTFPCDVRPWVAGQFAFYDQLVAFLPNRGFLDKDGSLAFSLGGVCVGEIGYEVKSKTTDHTVQSYISQLFSYFENQCIFWTQKYILVHICSKLTEDNQYYTTKIPFLFKQYKSIKSHALQQHKRDSAIQHHREAILFRDKTKVRRETENIGVIHSFMDYSDWRLWCVVTQLTVQSVGESWRRATHLSDAERWTQEVKLKNVHRIGQKYYT